MRIAGLCTPDVVTAIPTERVVDIAGRMREQHVGDVVIIASEADRHPIGILTDRDIVMTAVAQRPQEIETLVARDIMSTDLVVAQADMPMESALQLMRDAGIRRLPVVSESGRLVGIVTLDDLLELMVDEIDDIVAVIATEQGQERSRRRSRSPMSPSVMDPEC